MKHRIVLAACRLSAMIGLAWQLCGQARTAEPEWKVGVASVKITPERPVPMAGYAARTRPFEQVEADIFAKALALEDAEGHRAVLVTSDLIGLRAAVAEGICAHASEKTGPPMTSSAMLEEGGYETRGLSGGAGYFAASALDVVVAHVRRLAERVGRKVPP